LSDSDGFDKLSKLDCDASPFAGGLFARSAVSPLKSLSFAVAGFKAWLAKSLGANLDESLSFPLVPSCAALLVATLFPSAPSDLVPLSEAPTDAPSAIGAAHAPFGASVTSSKPAPVGGGEPGPGRVEAGTSNGDGIPGDFSEQTAGLDVGAVSAFSADFPASSDLTGDEVLSFATPAVAD
jgi:hypothetical protein